MGTDHWIFMQLQGEGDFLLDSAIELRSFLYIHEERADTCKSCSLVLGFVTFLVGSYL